MSVIDGQLLIDVSRQLGFMEQLSLLETPLEITLELEAFSDLKVNYSWLNENGREMSLLYFVNHPAFEDIRSKLEREGYLEVNRVSFNSDKVLKSFVINGINFFPGDRFLCASALRTHVEKKTKPL